MCRSIIQASAPRSFTQRARNPARNVVIGDPHVVFAPAYGSPFVHDLDDGRRYATIEDFRNFVKLTYMTRRSTRGGTLCEPVDLPVNKRHFDMVCSHIRYSDKAFMGSVTHPSGPKTRSTWRKIVFGAETIGPRTRDHGPGQRQLADVVGLQHARVGARSMQQDNQASFVTPFILAGAMAPVTVAGGGHPDPGGGPGRHGLLPDRATRRAGHLRFVRLVDVDAVGRPDLRHPRTRSSCCS